MTNMTGYTVGSSEHDDEVQVTHVACGALVSQFYGFSDLQSINTGVARHAMSCKKHGD